MYKIANIHMCVESNALEQCIWNQFEINSKDSVEDCIFLEEINFEYYHGVNYINWGNEYSHLFFINDDMMSISEDRKMAKVVSDSTKVGYSALSLQFFYTHAVQRHMIQFHSSLIDYRGHGLMFLGPSGIGKTTQAELWNQYRNALIINGDIVFVQETEEAFLGWGTPWHGSSPYCENTNVPVEALIILKQAPENSIRKLEGFEKVTAVSNSVFYPQWLENGMELCLETLDHLLSKIPVYELSCRPDEEAVELTEKTIFGREN
ncbi:MAG: hypothetical protein U0M78_10355 [Sellimonas sp.]|nr:hypothetical protein [Sellimonas sp.]